MTTRTRTILFTDIVGSTELLGRLAERDAERLRHAHLSALRENIDRRRGHVVKNLGDGVMASFEAAGDAIECAVALQQATLRAAATSGHGLAIRIGISSGDVFVDDGDCFGTAVVEASRICARATGGQVLLAGTTRLLARAYKPLTEVGDVTLKGLAETVTLWEAPYSTDLPTRLRVVLADDAVLVREGIARVLEARGIEVIAQAGDAETLIQITTELCPDVAIVDVRMPPTHTVEGLDAAECILSRRPKTSVLLLSQDLQPHYARRLLDARPCGVGYLLKESIADTREFADAITKIAAGGTAFAPDLVQQQP